MREHGGRILVSAPGSGCGKTVAAMGLIAALKARGIRLQSFKCGPDYIDPMFHERVLGIPCRNLDTYLMGEAEVLEELSDAEGRGELAVIEGAMGLSDGLGGTSAHSAAAIASLSRTPVLLVLDAHGKPSDDLSCGLVRGVLVNRCTEGEYLRIREEIGRQYPEIRVFGYLPELPEADLDSRHLGLVTAQEVDRLEERAARIGEALEQYADVGGILDLARSAGAAAQGSAAFPDPQREGRPPAQSAAQGSPALSQSAAQDSFALSQSTAQGSPALSQSAAQGSFAPAPQHAQAGACRIAVAKDEAFCFYYRRSLDNLERAGAQLCFFSPLHDAHLPDGIGGLYLGGGYPELYAGELEENASMRSEVASAVRAGLPTVAECGGFLYLGREIFGADGRAHAAAGVFGGSASKQERLVRFGYLELISDLGSSLLFEKGGQVRAHEFHYWDSTDNGSCLLAWKRTKDLRWRCGYTGSSLYAAFPHIYLDAGRAGRFVRAASAFPVPCPAADQNAEVEGAPGRTKEAGPNECAEGA